MFASPTRPIDPGALKALGERIRPISAARTRRLPVTPPLLGLLPTGLQRGTTLGVTSDGSGGATTLALSLIAGASQAGSWGAVVGFSDLGARAAEQVGIDLTRLVCLPTPGIQWAEAISRLIEGVDVVLLRPPRHVRPLLVRRLLTRVRNRRAVLVVLHEERMWPETCDIEIRVYETRWEGVGAGEDCLRRRRLTVSLGGRRHPTSARPHHLWLSDEHHALLKSGDD